MKKPQCSTCKHNPMGTCELANRELSSNFILSKVKEAPGWCPLIKKGRRK